MIELSGADSLICPYKDKENDRACLQKPERQEHGKNDGMKLVKYMKRCKRNKPKVFSGKTKNMRGFHKDHEYDKETNLQLIKNK